jgi:hypothetical protein
MLSVSPEAESFQEMGEATPAAQDARQMAISVLFVEQKR